ncbi:MAG: D-alanyl-D-alanine carboxypeptidase, partial [Acinetobacter towneri]
VYQNNQLINSFAIEEQVQIAEANIFERIMMWFGNLFNFFGQQTTEDQHTSLG